MRKYPPRAGGSSPWGEIQDADMIAEGIFSVYTAGHGGIWLSADRLEQMPADERSTDGWYEEDSEMAFPLRRFRDEVDLNALGMKAEGLDRFIKNITDNHGSFAEIAMGRSPGMEFA